jgi:tetratricopeptide (TPR) repeat protein
VRLLVAIAAVTWASSAPLHAQDLDRVHRELKDIEGDTQQLRKSPLSRSQLRSSTHVEERLTDGELFFRLRDYVRASVIFTDIVDNHPQHRAYFDALFLLSESLFKAKDYLGARTRYRIIIDRADQEPFRAYVQRALGRLIEIAIHIRDFDGVDEYFARLSKLPPSEVEAATNYFRAKYLYSVAVGEAESARGEVTSGQVNQDQLEQARLGFEAVNERSPYYGQARYFIGVIYLLRGQLAPAIGAFQRVSALRTDNEDQRRVVELSYLAVGRLNYELDQLDRAIEAYQRVPRNSPLFDTALYEIAWVYIRMGDSTRAERALEVLSVAVPDSQHIPDGKLLRGNLLLRDGHFRDATQVFNDVSGQFGPVRDELDRVLASHEDVQAYFRQTVRQNLDVFDAATFLPPQALRWAASEGEMQRAMDTLSDLTQARQLVGETESIVARLNSALSSPNPVNVFADLRSHRQRTTVLRNRLARARKDLATIEQKANERYTSAELESLRQRRREVERELAAAPTRPEDVDRRSTAALGQFAALAKELSRLEVELLGMEARITATERFTGDTMKGRDPQAMEAVRSELSAQKSAVSDYRKRIAQLDMQLETGRLQVGVGDRDFERERQLREEHAALIERERQILRSLGARPNERVEQGFRNAATVELQVDQHDQQIDAIVVERVGEMRGVLNEEGAKLTGYRARLGELETESEEVVGGIALDNFRKVRQRFYDLVLRADVGIIDVSWAVREEHRMRAEVLTRERARSLQALDDEYRDIMDQQTESEP